MSAGFQTEAITDAVNDALKTHLKTIHSLLGAGSTREVAGLHAGAIQAAATIHAAAWQAVALDRLAIAIRAKGTD